MPVDRILPLIIPNGMYTPHYFSVLSYLWNTENKTCANTLRRLKEDQGIINIYSSSGAVYTANIANQEKRYVKLVEKLVGEKEISAKDRLLIMNMVLSGFTLISENLIQDYSRNLLRDHGVASAVSGRDFTKEWNMMLSDLGIMLITEEKRDFIVSLLRSLNAKTDAVSQVNTPSNRFYMGCILANKTMAGNMSLTPITSYPLL
jgi:hypothetical protein